MYNVDTLEKRGTISKLPFIHLDKTKGKKLNKCYVPGMSIILAVSFQLFV